MVVIKEVMPGVMVNYHKINPQSKPATVTQKSQPGVYGIIKKSISL